VKLNIFFITVLALSPLLVEAQWSGEVAIEARYHWQDAHDASQRDQNLSLSFEPEYSTSWDGGDQSFTFKPFFRIDSSDDKRSHIDLREAVWTKFKDDWEVRIGIDKVYWGVTEANHLVDIINQTDILENPDGEQKLGQPMLKYSKETDWGTLDAYLMPWFREREYAGQHGRLRTQPRVDVSQAQYENDLKEHYPDIALRWSHSIGDWDIGVSQFHGTSREPRFIGGIDAVGNPVLIPRYDIIQQTGLDLQATLDDWLWKVEVIHRNGQGETFNAATGGFEYTFVGIANTNADMGVLMEVMMDDRGNNATTPLNHDVFIGMRWVGNDVQSSELLSGVVWDWENHSQFYNVEASRRLGESWKASLQLRAWVDIPNNDPAFAFEADDYIEMKLVKYF